MFPNCWQNKYNNDIYIFNFNIFPQCIYLYWIYSGNNYMLYLCVSLFCKTLGSQFSRGPICRTNIFQGPNLPGPDLPGPNLPPRGPICRGPICRGPICRGPICRGPICRTQNFPGPNLPVPNLPGPNLPQKIAWGPICRGPICLEPVLLAFYYWYLPQIFSFLSLRSFTCWLATPWISGRTTLEQTIVMSLTG